MTETNERETQMDEALNMRNQLAKADQLPPDLMLLKMENEQIFSIARVKPRDYASLVKQLIASIEAYPAAADDAIYVKPVGTIILIECGDCKTKYEVSYIPKEGVSCPKCESAKIGSQKRKKKFAEGLSIRAAESIRSIFGFTRLSIRMEVLPDEKVMLQGVLVDYCAGNITADERVVSPFYKSRFGNMQRHPEDRFLNVIVKAEKAKLRRDVILDSVPNMVKQAFRDACEKKLEKLVDKEQIEKKVIPYFSSKGVTQEHLEKIVGRPMSMGWTQAEIIMLSKIKTALENEETTAAELLADLEEKKEEPPTKTNGPVSGENLSKPAAEQTKAEKESPQPTTPPPETTAGAHPDNLVAPDAKGQPSPPPPSNPPQPPTSLEDYAAQQEWATEAKNRYAALIADNNTKPDFNTLVNDFLVQLNAEKERIGKEAYMTINADLIAAYKEWDAKHRPQSTKKPKK